MEQTSSETSSNMTLLDLPDNLLLHHILSKLAAAPHTLLHFSCTCKQAHRLANAPGLWASFCQHQVRSELSSCFAQPEHWKAASHKQLWIGLLLPYGQLLGRLWHSTSAPSGMLLAVDAEAPRLVARSIYYKTLNGGPFCHDIFAVELPGSDSKAVVTCWRDKHTAETFEAEAQLVSAADAGSGNAAASALAATAAAATGEGLSTAVAGSCSCSSGSSSSIVDPLTGFKLCCGGRCNSFAVEIASRRFASKRYQAVRQQHLAAQQQQQQQQAGSLPDRDSSSGSSEGAPAESSSDGSAPAQQQPCGSLAPLPEMRQANTIDLFHIISLADMRNSLVPPVFKPLDLRPWLPAAPWHASSQASGIASLPAGPAAAAAEPELADACAAVSAAALSLPGCWRGTYGTHAIEVVQLQLLLAPPGYDMFAAPGAEAESAAAAAAVPAAVDGVDALAADHAVDAVSGVLLAGGAGVAGPTARQTASGSAVSAQEGGGHVDHQQQQQQQQALTVAADDWQRGSTEYGKSCEEQREAAAATPEQRPRPRQLLLVATKLTGDVNVPAGAVTFAADLVSRSTAGAGARLLLPPGTDCDVQLNRAGMRQLRVKERYRGRAQIAYTDFDRPQVIAAELVLFDSPDCIGLLWKQPMDSFSLFSRASQLPGVPAA